MNTVTSSDPKRDALQRQKTLNPKPLDVKNPLFQDSEFFDSRDLIQVKYEMLRQAQQDGKSVKETTVAFGFSRVAFYQIRRQFEENGLAGLLPIQRGPRSAHKLTDEIMDYVEQVIAQDLSLRAPVLVELMKERFGISVHRRSIERALVRRQKKLQS
ncbi:MAG: helix-turn-helix domain-containing protein [Candidatus Hatepunaea meridiana]|nr:helix-turn-helix domain-containing protein [Candidatus Hatepunaea meridiana]